MGTNCLTVSIFGTIIFLVSKMGTMEIYMDNKILLQRLKEKIDESGLTLAEVAEKAGVSVRSLKYYFKNERIPKVSYLLKLNKVIEFKFDYLYQFGKYEL